jgi:hypothetical protein
MIAKGLKNAMLAKGIKNVCYRHLKCFLKAWSRFYGFPFAETS